MGRHPRKCWVVVERFEDDNHVSLVTTSVTKARKKLWTLATAEGLTRPENEKHVMSGEVAGFSDDDYIVELFEEEIRA